MNNSIKKNVLIINFSKAIGIDLTYALANKGSNLLLNGEYEIEERSSLVKSISQLGVKCYHHAADILDLKELDLLLADSRRQLDRIDIVLVLISLDNHESVFPVVDKTIEILNEQNYGKLFNLMFSKNLDPCLNNKKEIDTYCNKKLESFLNLEYHSIRYEDYFNIDDLVLHILYNKLIDT